MSRLTRPRGTSVDASDWTNTRIHFWLCGAIGSSSQHILWAEYILVQVSMSHTMSSMCISTLIKKKTLSSCSAYANPEGEHSVGTCTAGSSEAAHLQVSNVIRRRREHSCAFPSVPFQEVKMLFHTRCSIRYYTRWLMECYNYCKCKASRERFCWIFLDKWEFKCFWVLDNEYFSLQSFTDSNIKPSSHFYISIT